MLRERNWSIKNLEYNLENCGQIKNSLAGSHRILATRLCGIAESVIGK